MSLRLKISIQIKQSAAARKLHVSHSTLLNYMDKDKLFKGRFIIKRKIINSAL